MVNGQMICHGTPSFLMTKYGRGNLITLTLDLKRRLNLISDLNLEELVKQKIPGASKITSQALSEEPNKVQYRYQVAQETPLAVVFK